MPPERYIYYCLLIIAVVLCYNRTRNCKGLIYIFWLLIAATGTELTGEYLKYSRPAFRYLPYHFYIPVEYTLTTLFMSVHIPVISIKKVMRWTIPLFVVCSAAISFANRDSVVLPSVQYNLEGTLIIVWSLIALFNLPVDIKGKKIISFPLVWLSAGYLLLFSGQFFMNGFYNYLLNHGEQGRLQQLVFIVYYCLNYLFYLLMIIGFLCMKATGKYI